MTNAFRAFHSLGVVALFEEAAGGGDPLVPSSDCNAPAADPDGNLDKLKFHSSLDHLEVAFDVTVTVSHGLGGAATITAVQNGVVFNEGGTDYDVYTHGLGYSPLIDVLLGDQEVHPGMPVQTDTGGRARYVYPYVTSSKVRFHECRSATGSTLAALSQDYRIIGYREARDASGDVLMDFDPGTGIMTMGFGRFSSDRVYAQIADPAEAADYLMFLDRSADLANGAPRFINPDLTTFDPVPTNMQMRIDSHYSFGSGMYYTGSFAGSDVLRMVIP